ncbi:MAG: response regulator transcription factor [Dehalococcoidia bacterium]|nr:MAG: response regulator transcription factor [Dehalococcoidia bacterium]
MTTTTEPTVLALDDEPGILRLIKLELAMQGFSVVTARDGATALSMLESEHPDIALLDVVVPDMSGLDVMRQMRERSNIPVILLTAKGAGEDKVRGLELGADDYISKPFSPEELTARVRAVLRRTRGAGDEKGVVRINDVEIDLDRRLVKRGDQLLTLTRTEWMLLEHLASNAGKLLLNRALLSKVWGPEYWDDLQYLRVWISRLRRKLEADPAHPQLIKTFQGVGYMLDDGSGIRGDDDDAIESVELPAEPKLAGE